MPRRLSPREWIEKYLEPIQNQEIIQICLEASPRRTELKYWTFLKLAALYSYAYYTYLPIIGSKYRNPVYIDLFSGSGICGTDDINFIGSSILMAVTESSRGFHFKKCIYVESDSESATALKKRLEKLDAENILKCEDYKVIPKDCNDPEALDEILNEIPSSQKHILLFVDPYCVEIKFSTLKRFIDEPYLYFDMYLTFNFTGIARILGDAPNNPNKATILTEFFGNDSWRNCIEEGSIRNCLRNLYPRRLKEEGGDKIKYVKAIEVKSGTSPFLYDLIFTTRKENSPWLMGIDRIKRMVELCNGVAVRNTLDLPSLEVFDENERN